MIDTSEDTTLTGQIKSVLRDAAAYFGSTLQLAQARFVELALSSVVFVGLLALAFLFCVAALILLNVALGIWLTHVTGHVGWSLLILGAFYLLMAAALSFSGLRWLKRLSS